MKKKNIFAALLLLLSIVAAVFVLTMTFMAIKRVGEDYASLKNNDLSQDMSATLFYDDHIYAQIGYGIEIVSGYKDMAKDRDDFLVSSLRSLDGRIVSCGTLYTMMISVVLAYYLYVKNEDNNLKHVLSIILSVIVFFVIYLLVALLGHVLNSMPFRLTGSWLKLLVSLLSIIGGNCFLAVLFRLFRFKKILAVLAIPLVFILFIFGFVFEHGIYCSPYIESFEYVAEIDPRILDEDFEGPVYYDEEKNVLIVEDKQYEPERLVNDEHLEGPTRIAACAYEALDPYAGNTLYFLEEVDEITIPIKAIPLYVVKATIWMIAALTIKRNR